MLAVLRHVARDSTGATCAAAMRVDCGSIQQNDTLCLACMSTHSEALGTAGCTTFDAEQFCGIDSDREHNPRDSTYHPGDSYENVVPWIPSSQQPPFDPADPPMVLFDISKDPNGSVCLSKSKCSSSLPCVCVRALISGARDCLHRVP